MYVGDNHTLIPLRWSFFTEQNNINDGMGNQNLHNNILIAMNSDLDLVENTT